MKRRLSASIDDELLSAAEAAVREGHAPSVSALVEEALRMQMERTRKLAAADELFDLLDERRGTPMSQAESQRLAAEFEATAIWPNGRGADDDARTAA